MQGKSVNVPLIFLERRLYSWLYQTTNGIINGGNNISHITTNSFGGKRAYMVLSVICV